MRIVSILILLTVAAAVYVANFVAVDDPNSGPNVKPPAALSSDVVSADASESDADPDPSAVGAELPEAFPSELTRRSGSLRSGGADLDAPLAPSGTLPSAEPTAKSSGRRVGPKLREPQMDLDPETEALLEERLSGGAAGSTARPRRRPAREVGMPKAPARVAAGDRPIEDIVLPTKPGDVRVIDQAQIAAVEQGPLGKAPAKPAAESLLDSRLDSRPKVDETVSATVSSDVPASAPQTAVSVGALGGMTLSGSVVDTSGKALPGVGIEVVRLSSGQPVRSLKSGPGGAFSADGFAVGRYVLRIDSATVPLGIASPVESENCRTGEEPAGYGSTCVDIRTSGSEAARIELPLSSGIQGTVLGVAGAPQKGALVRAVSQVEGFRKHAVVTKTDGEGFFFLGLVPGPYELQMLIPGEGKPADLTRRMKVTAKPGSALLLDAVDFSKKAAPDDEDMSASMPAITEPSLGSEAPAAANLRSAKKGSAKKRSAKEGSTVTLAAAPAKPELAAEPLGARSGGSEIEASGFVELRGRVISKWGEALPALSIIAETLDGEIIEATQTSDAGQYILEEIPVGRAIIRVASDLELNREGARGTTLLKRPEPILVQTFSGQKRVAVEDAVVEVRRMYRLQGRIKIDPVAFEEFKKGVNLVEEGADPLSDKHYRRAYYRGLRLTQRNKGKGRVGQRRGQSIQIAGDGSFVWQCTLPADDILLVLEPRTTRKNIGYRGAIGIPVTPAGVRPATLEIPYPPAAEPNAKKGSKKGADAGRGDALTYRTTETAAASARVAVGPIALTR